MQSFQEIYGTKSLKIFTRLSNHAQDETSTDEDDYRFIVVWIQGPGWVFGKGAKFCSKNFAKAKISLQGVYGRKYKVFLQKFKTKWKKEMKRICRNMQAPFTTEAMPIDTHVAFDLRRDTGL